MILTPQEQQVWNAAFASASLAGLDGAGCRYWADRAARQLRELTDAERRASGGAYTTGVEVLP